jgi:hypothetical protein
VCTHKNESTRARFQESQESQVPGLLPPQQGSSSIDYIRGNGADAVGIEGAAVWQGAQQKQQERVRALILQP